MGFEPCVTSETTPLGVAPAYDSNNGYHATAAESAMLAGEMITIYQLSSIVEMIARLHTIPGPSGLRDDLENIGRTLAAKLSTEIGSTPSTPEA